MWCRYQKLESINPQNLRIMIFKETKLKGAYIIELEPLEDERGFFARTYCQKKFKKNGINIKIVQCNVSYNRKRGTLRGMHYQKAPHEEAKLISCLRGAIYDVIIDLRSDSPTYCQWFAIELSSNNYRILYVPEGFAHGFQTLDDDTVIFYQMSESYYPECAMGVRWDDKTFGIKWPRITSRIISEKDLNYPLLSYTS